MVSKTYPSTLSGLRGRVYDRALSASTAKHSLTDEKIRAALNDGQREVQNELLLAFHTRYFVKTDENMSPVNNRIELPADFKRLVGFDKDSGDNSNWYPVRVIPASQYEKYRTVQYPALSGASLPEYESWSMVHNHMESHGTATITGTYRLRWQYQIPDLQSDDQKTEIPDEYQEMLVDYAAWIMEEDSGTVERAGRHAARYERRVMQMRRTSKQLSMVEKRTVRNVRGRRGI